MARSRRSAAEWRELINECENSGKTAKEWCASHSVNINTYRNRVIRFRKIMADEDQLSVEKENRQPINQNWTEVITGISEEAETSLTTALHGKLMIEAGSLRITAYTGYPAEALAIFIGRLMKLC